MKKRVISLVVALCMMLSLIPFTAFAESNLATPLPADTEWGALVLDAYGVPILHTGVNNVRPDIKETDGLYEGLGWKYDAPQGQTTAVLYLLGDFDLSSQVYSSSISKNITVILGRTTPSKICGTLKNATVKGDLTIENGSTLENTSCEGSVTNKGIISGNGSFAGNVKNDGTISGGNFDGRVDNTETGTITDGTFNNTVGNEGSISGGNFNSGVDNAGTGSISNGSFAGDVKNDGIISGGNFKDTGKVDNSNNISGGTFDGKVDNVESGTISDGTFNGDIDNKGTISGGDFGGRVNNTETGIITDGTFNNTVGNEGSISGGNFNNGVDNAGTGNISNGSFAGDIKNDGTISGGSFTGKADNTENGTISGGEFNSEVDNKGSITDGDFKDADKVDNSGTITGGDFNGNVDNHPGSTYEPTTDSATTPENPDNPSDQPSNQPSDDPSDPPSDPSPTLYTVTIEGGTINGQTSVTAKENEELTAILDQNAIPDGMTFDMWAISSSKLTGDLTVAYRSETMTFLMPPEDVTIRAQYRSAEIPDGDPYNHDDSGFSPAGVALLAATGTAATAVALWSGYQFVADSYLKVNLPEGTAVPTSRRELALLMWKTAGKPEVELTDLYSDIDEQDIELRKAAQWTAENQLMNISNERNLTLFDPDNGVSNLQVFHAWRKLKKLLSLTDVS